MTPDLPMLDPTPTIEDIEFVGTFDGYDDIQKARANGLRRAATYRRAMEDAAELANIADMTKPGSAGQYIYERLAAFDQSLREKEKADRNKRKRKIAELKIGDLHTSGPC